MKYNYICWSFINRIPSARYGFASFLTAPVPEIIILKIKTMNKSTNHFQQVEMHSVSDAQVMYQYSPEPTLHKYHLFESQDSSLKFPDSIVQPVSHHAVISPEKPQVHGQKDLASLSTADSKMNKPLKRIKLKFLLAKYEIDLCPGHLHVTRFRKQKLPECFKKREMKADFKLSEEEIRMREEVRKFDQE